MSGFLVGRYWRGNQDLTGIVEKILFMQSGQKSNSSIAELKIPMIAFGPRRIVIWAQSWVNSDSSVLHLQRSQLSI